MFISFFFKYIRLDYVTQKQDYVFVLNLIKEKVVKFVVVMIIVQFNLLILKGHGKCQKNSECLCDVGYTGPTCS